MGKISRTRGKNVELAVARYMGCRRNHFEREDLSYPILSIEVKHRRAVAKMLVTAMAQAEAAAPDGKVPVVVLHEERQPYAEAFAMMRLRDLREIVGD